MFEIAELVGQEVEAAGAPEGAGSFWILQQRVAALDDAVGNDAEKRAAIVVALAGAKEELVDVFGGFIRGEGEAERAEVGRDDGFEVGGALGPGGAGREKEKGR